MFDVLILTKNDWSNTGWRFSECLRMLGLDVLFLKANTHVFWYPNQGLIHPALTKVCNEDGEKGDKFVYYVPELRAFAENSHIVHFRDSMMIDTGVDLTKKHVVTQHGGRTYRVYHEKINKIFNKYTNATLIQMPDLLGKGANNEHLIYYPVQTKVLKPKYERRDKKIIIGHFPTSQIDKGSGLVISTLKEIYQDYPKLRDKFSYIGPEDFKKSRDWILIWSEHLKRVAYCDVIIETISMQAQGLPFGEWGNQAIEAAALGKIVITNSLSTDLYEKEYGPGNALKIANDGDALKGHLLRILEMPDDEILTEKKKSREWVEKYHSMEATAERLWNKIYSGFAKKQYQGVGEL